MKYKIEELLISDDGEVFRPGSIVDIVWKENFKERTVHGKYCGYYHDFHGYGHAKVM